MVVCNFCQRKETRNRHFNLPYTCNECEINNNNYINNEDEAIVNDDEIIFINSLGKQERINDNTELNIHVEIASGENNGSTTDTQNNVSRIKTVLENSDTININSGSMIKREHDAMGLIMTTIDMLHSQIEFLQEEIREKNLLIKILNHRNANDGQLVDVDLIEGSIISPSVETTSLSESTRISNYNEHDDPDYNEHSTPTYDCNMQRKIVDYNTTDEDINNTGISVLPVEMQLNDYRLKQREKFLNVNSNENSNSDQSDIILLSSTPINFTIVDEMDSLSTVPSDINDGDYSEEQLNLENLSDEPNSENPFDNRLQSITDLFVWQKHSSGAAAKIMNKMGYKGKGLGKTESGITEPISNKPKVFINDGKNNEEEKNIPKRKRLHILSDSMLNQMNEWKLSKHLDVVVDCHGGCTIQCVYTHLAPLLITKPDYVLLNIGTNDCTSKTSDEVLREITKLAEFIEFLLPDCCVIISLPTIRTDSKKANAIIGNYNFKIKRANFKHMLLENFNINESHISRKGLHFNGVGLRKMASNIISLTKQL